MRHYRVADWSGNGYFGVCAIIADLRSNCHLISFLKTGIILRKAVLRSNSLPDESNKLNNYIKGEVAAGGFSTMSSSPATTTTSRNMAGARTLDREFDLRAVIKQQRIKRDLPLPSLTASQILTCENALKQLKLKAKGNGGRNLNGAIDCEFDTLQVCM